MKQQYVGMGLIEKNDIILDVNRFSNYNKLRKTLAWIIRFKQNSQARKMGRNLCSTEITIYETN